MQNIEELSDKLAKEQSKINQVELIADFILHELKGYTPDKAKSTSEIIERYNVLKTNHPSIPDIPRTTFTVYLSKTADSPNSKINCDGRKQGYYLDTLFEKIEEINKLEQEKENLSDIKEEDEIYSFKEKEIYPFLKEWLLSNDCNRVSDISSGRRQGVWGNPDLLGLKIETMFGSTEVEITTIEVKITNDGWRKWIFESVAHTVFANRVYFAFIHPETQINKIEPEIKDYAEIFNIGLLVIAVSGENYLKIKNREKFTLKEDNHRIVVLAPAPLNVTQIKYKKRFLQGLDITEPIHLFNYGEGIK